MYLNNKRYFCNGVLDQGYFPDGIYTPASYKAYAFDILSMKNLGFKVNQLYRHCNTIEDVISYIEEMGQKRPDLPYDIDGIVLKVNEMDLHDISDP